MNRIVRRVVVATGLLAFVCQSPAVAYSWQEDKPQDTSSDVAGAVPFDSALQLASFDQVWETVRKTHWDFAPLEERWNQAREELRPKVESATSINEVRALIEELIGVVKLSHYALVPSDEYHDLNETGGPGGEGAIGMEARLVGDQIVVTKVRAGSPAEAAGIQPGWVLKKIGKKTGEEIIEAARDTGKHGVMRADTVAGLICDVLASGEPGSEISLTLLDHDDSARELTLVHAPASGDREIFANLPPVMVEYEDRLIDDEIGYIRFNAFIGAPRLAASFQESIAKMRASKGLVIDLRGNRGGIVVLVAGMCGWLTSERKPLGEMKMAGTGAFRPTPNPRKPRFEGPVAVLIDECSISSAEIMAGGIKDLELGRVFGKTSAGLALPSIVVKLPNGDRFQYAIASWKSASGEALEGVGVIPHETVELTRERLKEEVDPVLTAALEWIRSPASSAGQPEK